MVPAYLRVVGSGQANRHVCFCVAVPIIYGVALSSAALALLAPIHKMLVERTVQTC